MTQITAGLTSIMWWPLAAGLAALLIAAIIAGLLAARRRRAQRTAIPVAHTGYLRNLPSFRAVVRARRRRLAIALAAFTLAGLAAAGLAGRPAERHVESERLATRDIVLCLDVSGSMISYDSEILGKFSQLAENFSGERIALVMWNNTSRTLFPLTDDYAMVKEELSNAAKVLDVDLAALTTGTPQTQQLLDLLAGTTALPGTSASLIGDGLANCVLAFDLSDQERSRSIIFATDNDLQGTPVYQLAEAATFAQERNIRVIGLFSPTAEGGSTKQRADFTEAITSRGGLVFDTGSPEAVDSIIDDVTSQQAAELDASPNVVITDHPERLAPVLLIGLVGGLALLGWWRL
ncbi:vWA domain-containing protein [Bowdeniella nasicola]|nr:VWA domain-containing protein [Bowdeniella nasicola]